MDDRIEEHFGGLTIEISRLSAELKAGVEANKPNLKSHGAEWPDIINIHASLIMN